MAEADERYDVRRLEGDGPLAAAHPFRDQVALFDRDQVRVTFGGRDDEPLGVSLSLAGVGRDGGELSRPAAAEPEATANRVEYQRGAGLTEWYPSGPPGLEQGFRIARRPGG